VKIANDMVVTLEYTITDEEGTLVDTTAGRRPLVYIQGHDQIVPGVEMALAGQEEGTELDISVPPEAGYGRRDPEAKLVIPRRSFPDADAVAAGDVYRAVRADGKPVVFSVVQVDPDSVTVDANHPLAGQTLRVRVEILAVRAATAEERQHGHVHGDANLQA
jgi:FKBP-type peptidyl-prolyl cis-trans isomerase SlyD